MPGEGFYSQISLPGLTPRSPKRGKIIGKRFIHLTVFPASWISLPASWQLIYPVSPLIHLLTISHIDSFRRWICTWDMLSSKFLIQFVLCALTTGTKKYCNNYCFPLSEVLDVLSSERLPVKHHRESMLLTPSLM